MVLMFLTLLNKVTFGEKVFIEDLLMWMCSWTTSSCWPDSRDIFSGLRVSDSTSPNDPLHVRFSSLGWQHGKTYGNIHPWKGAVWVHLGFGPWLCQVTIYYILLSQFPELFMGHHSRVENACLNPDHRFQHDTHCSSYCFNSSLTSDQTCCWDVPSPMQELRVIVLFLQDSYGRKKTS